MKLSKRCSRLVVASAVVATCLIVIGCAEKDEEGTIIIDSPTSNAEWYIGETHSIRWHSDGDTGDNVSIALWQSGILKYTLAESSPNIGILDWTIPDWITPSYISYDLRIDPTKGTTGYQNFYVYQGSGGGFSVTLPNASTVWHLGQENVSVAWITGGMSGTVEIKLFNDDQGWFITIASSTSNDGSYGSWDVPTNIQTGGNYRVQLTHSEGNVVSSSYFQVEQ